ncbi:ferric/cupric reductase transmembrane component 1 [[Candida] anglica]
MKISHLIALATSVTLVAAMEELKLIYSEPEIRFLACTGLLAKTATLFGKKDKKGYCNVKNQVALGSAAHCFVDNMNKKGVNYFIEECEITEEQFYAAYDNATQYLVDVTKVEGFNKTKLLSSPIKLKQVAVNRAYDSIYTRWINYNYATWYSVVLLSYWFAAIFIAGICNFLSFAFPDVLSFFNGSASKLFRKYITLPATIRRKHAASGSFMYIFAGLIPTRLESILVLGWFILALVFNIDHIDHVSHNFVWASTKAEMGRKIADRSGIIACYLVPIQILFAGRNNFTQWISGWSYSRMILLHRWISRITFILVLVHTIAMSISGVALGKFVSRNNKPYVIWGYVATVAGFIILIQAMMKFRNKNYELFLAIHILFAVFWIVGGWIHVADDGYERFYIAAVAAWCFDRVMRFARLFAFGIQTAHVQLKANETLKVTVPRPKYWKPFPGCHAFVHFMRPTCFWQSHPFTIVDSVEKDNTIVFYMKVKGGATHGLYQYLAQQPGHAANIKMSVEGPYGNRIPISKYSTSVFLAGGNGIPGLYSEAIDLVKKSSGERKIRFYWVIRHWKSMEWFYEELKKFEGTCVEPIVYVTQPGSGLVEPIGSSDEASSSDDEKKNDVEKSEDHVQNLMQSLHFIEFREGRPDLDAIVKQEISESDGPIGIVSCAHPSMVDGIRYAVTHSLDASKHRVDYFEQIQSW